MSSLLPISYLDSKTTDLKDNQTKKLNDMLRFYVNRFISKSNVIETDFEKENIELNGPITPIKSLVYNGTVYIKCQLVLSNVHKGVKYELMKLEDKFIPEGGIISVKGSTGSNISDPSHIVTIWYEDGYIWYMPSIDIESLLPIVVFEWVIKNP